MKNIPIWVGVDMWQRLVIMILILVSSVVSIIGASCGKVSVLS